MSLGHSILQSFSFRTEKLGSLETRTVPAREMEISGGGSLQGSKISAEVPLSQLSLFQCDNIFDWMPD